MKNFKIFALGFFLVALSAICFAQDVEQKHAFGLSGYVTGDDPVIGDQITVGDEGPLLVGKDAMHSYFIFDGGDQKYPLPGDERNPNFGDQRIRWCCNWYRQNVAAGLSEIRLLC